MSDLLNKARTRVGVAVIGAALLAVGGTATAAVVATSPASDESPVEAPAPSSDEVTPTSEAAPTSAAPAPAEVPETVAPTLTVVPMSDPEAPAPEAAASTPIVDPADTGIGTTGDDGRYTPAPQVQQPGEPPVLPEEVPVPAEKLPGEAGYVPPVN